MLQKKLETSKASKMSLSKSASQNLKEYELSSKSQNNQNNQIKNPQSIVKKSRKSKSSKKEINNIDDLNNDQIKIDLD